MRTVKLVISGLGHCPSFKNGKMLIPGPPPRMITDPEKKQWMDQAISQLEFQLRGLFPIEEGETDGEWRKRLRTVLWQLSDDSLNQMIPGNQEVKYVNKGQEGVEITIEIP